MTGYYPDYELYEEWDDDDRYNPEDSCVICGRGDCLDGCHRCGSPMCFEHMETRLGFCGQDWCENNPEIDRDFAIRLGYYEPSWWERLKDRLLDWWHYSFRPWWAARFVHELLPPDDDGDIPF